MANINGRNTNNQKVSFDLTLREIKHIRRTIQLYKRIHPEIYYVVKKDNLSDSIWKKFDKFGRNKRPNNKSMNLKMEYKEHVCDWVGCEEKENLTIDHIKPFRIDNSSNKDELRYLCKAHHEIREISAILFRKIKEVKKLEEKRLNIEINLRNKLRVSGDNGK